LTPSGRIIVNGFVTASTYIALQDNHEMALESGLVPPVSHQEYIHLVLLPFRLLCMGVSSHFCNLANPSEIPFYIAWGMDLHQWASQQSVLLQVIFFGIVLVLCSVCMIAGSMFGSTFLLLAVFIAAGLVLAANRKKSMARIATEKKKKI
jgi:hypothetical protein